MKLLYFITILHSFGQVFKYFSPKSDISQEELFKKIVEDPLVVSIHFIFYVVFCNYITPCNIVLCTVISFDLTWYKYLRVSISKEA